MMDKGVETINERKITPATHKTPDLDALGSITLFLEVNNIQRIPLIFFTDSGDRKEMPLLSNVIEFDRGRGLFDHHGTQIPTSAQKVAEKYGLEINEHIFKFLKLVENNDLKGISAPFDLGDIIKRISHSTDDEKTAEIGIRIIRDALDFKQLETAEEIKRDHEFTRSVIKQFMNSRKFKGARLQKYYELLEDSEFKRPFDLCEILTMEKKLCGAKEARKFGLKLLALITKQERNFNKALKELENLKITKIYLVKGSNSIIVTVISSNPEINRAARFKWKTLALVIQKNPEIGGIQIFPNKKWLKDIEIIMDNLTAAIRLEEQMLSGRKRITTNYNVLRKGERLQWIPEWYYARERGYFLFNRSLTATSEEIPETKISLERIAQIAQVILRFRDKFNFQRYAAQRIARNLKQKKL